MAYDKRFIYYKTKPATGATNYPKHTLLAFMSNTREILTHGEIYGGYIGNNNVINLGGSSITPVKLTFQVNTDTTNKLEYDPFGNSPLIKLVDGTNISINSAKTTTNDVTTQTITINHGNILTSATNFKPDTGKMVDTIKVSKQGHITEVTYRDIAAAELPYATRTVVGGLITKTSPGIVNVGTNINLGSEGTISVNTATADTLGVVKTGVVATSGISVSAGELKVESAPKLQMPTNASGNAIAVGATNIPVYFDATGLPKAITQPISVSLGGTGLGTLESGKVLIGNGTGDVLFREIIDLETAGVVTSNTKLITANTLNNWTGSTNIATVGTISTGTWLGTKIANAYIANPKVTIAGNEVTLGGTLSASDLVYSLNLGSALIYEGISSTAITNGGSENPTINGSVRSNLGKGSVVVYNNLEFAWNGSVWQKFGDGGSYKVKQTAVSDPTASGTATAFIDSISQDINGNITVTKKNLKSYLESAGGTVSGDVILKYSTTNSAAPALIFRSGEVTDALTDWRLYSSAGVFSINYATNNGWQDSLELNSTNSTGKLWGKDIILDSMVGATADTAGKMGYVPAPPAGAQSKVLSGAGTWVTNTGNSWRGIYVGGTSKVSTGTGTKAINYSGTDGIEITHLAAGTSTGQSGSADYSTIKISGKSLSDRIGSLETLLEGLEDILATI